MDSSRLPEMPRRVFMAIIVAGLLAPPLTAEAQQATKIPHVEGKTVVLEYHYVEGKPERLPDLARDLVGTKPNAIFALGGDVAPFVRTATSTIPIIAAVSNDPVQSGLVATLARPGGNLTGVTFVSSDLAAKRMQLLKEIRARDLAGRRAVESRSHRPGVP